MRIYEIIWKDKFVGKLERKHNVTTDEVEQVKKRKRGQVFKLALLIFIKKNRTVPFSFSLFLFSFLGIGFTVVSVLIAIFVVYGGH